MERWNKVILAGSGILLTGLLIFLLVRNPPESPPAPANEIVVVMPMPREAGPAAPEGHDTTPFAPRISQEWDGARAMTLRIGSGARPDEEDFEGIEPSPRSSLWRDATLSGTNRARSGPNWFEDIPPMLQGSSDPMAHLERMGTRPLPLIEAPKPLIAP